MSTNRVVELNEDEKVFVVPLCLKSLFHSHQALAWCLYRPLLRNRFNGFLRERSKPLKRFSALVLRWSPG